jgi:hypothetical protein
MFFFFDFVISAFLFWFVGCVDCVSDAEQQLTTAGDVLFWKQIIEADQFLFSAFGRVTRWFNTLRNFFVFRCTHFERLLPECVPAFRTLRPVLRV